MIAELLAVTVAILIVFMMIYTNFLPTLGELELRNQYNNIDSQYETFYTRVLYLKMFDENQIIETSTLATIENSPNYITLVENGTCNATLFTDVTGFKTNCNSLIEKFGIEELILTSYDLTDIKTNYTGTKLKKYIKYLSSKTLNQDEINLYRLISKTDEGYATMSFYSQECKDRNCPNYTNEDWSLQDCKNVNEYRQIVPATSFTVTNLLKVYSSSHGWNDIGDTGNIYRTVDTVNTIIGHKYYVYSNWGGWAYANGGGMTSGVYFASEQVLYVGGSGWFAGPPGVNYNGSKIVQVSSASSVLQFYYHRWNASQGGVGMSGAVVVDITGLEAFAGKTFTLAELNSLIGGGWTGTKTVEVSGETFGEWSSEYCIPSSTCETRVVPNIDDYYELDNKNICLRGKTTSQMNCMMNSQFCDYNGSQFVNYTTFDSVADGTTCPTGSELISGYRCRQCEPLEGFEGNWSFAPCPQ